MVAAVMIEFEKWTDRIKAKEGGTIWGHHNTPPVVRQDIGINQKFRTSKSRVQYISDVLVQRCGSKVVFRTLTFTALCPRVFVQLSFQARFVQAGTLASINLGKFWYRDPRKYRRPRLPKFWQNHLGEKHF